MHAARRALAPASLGLATFSTSRCESTHEAAGHSSYNPASTGPGVVCAPTSRLAARTLRAVPELEKDRFYEAPSAMRNGHVHTCVQTGLRMAPVAKYHRALLETPDGGTVGVDLLLSVGPGVAPRPFLPFMQRRAARIASTSEGAAAELPAEVVAAVQADRKPFLLLASGLGGSSSESYVRSMAAAATARGYAVGVVNMRGTGDVPLTSPRFFSARHGSVDDMRLAVAYVREVRVRACRPPPRACLGEKARPAPPQRTSAHRLPPSQRLQHFDPAGKVVVCGWSNSGSVVGHLMADQGEGLVASTPAARVDAAVAMAAPLDGLATVRGLQGFAGRWLYSPVIAMSLLRQVAKHRELFDRTDGLVPMWGKEGYVRIDTDALIRCWRKTVPPTLGCFDEELTRKTFGFDSLLAYYAHADSGSRLKHVTSPILVVSSIDDPIAKGSEGDADTNARANENVVLVRTAHGGHLGWADKLEAPDAALAKGQLLKGRPLWVERVVLGFLDQAVLEPPPPPPPAR